MKLLILTVSAGEGHNSMSRAISNYVAEEYKEKVEIKQIDLFKGRKKFINYLVSKAYFKFCKHFIKFANSSFEKLKVRNPQKPSRAANIFVNRAIGFIKENLIEFKPDAVFCAHTFAAISVSRLREQGLKEALDARVVTVVSDYDVAPYTEFLTKVDYIITPNDDFDDVLKHKGFDVEKQRLSLGIPVQRKFSVAIDKKAARKELGVDENRVTLMMMNGGIGFDNTIKLIKNFSKAEGDFQVISVCGRNEKLKKQIDKLVAKGKLKNVYNYGFVNNVDVIMSASDLLIGKIGGVAIAEAFNKGLPILAGHKLPWQEYDNMVYLKERNACDYIDNKKLAYKKLESIVNNPERIKQMQQSLTKIRKQNASKDIGDLLVLGKVQAKK